MVEKVELLLINNHLIVVKYLEQSRSLTAIQIDR